MTINSLNVFSKLIFLAIFQAFSLVATGQNPSTMTTLRMESIEGTGPAGNSSMSISKLKDADTLTKELLPIYDIGVYNDFEDIEEYFYIVNRQQLYFQNYKNGKLSKSVFIRLMEESNWKLQDTLKLSPTPMKTVLRLLVAKRIGTDDNILIIDANQNGTYGDDVAQIAPSRSAISSGSAKPIPVSIDFRAENGISTEKVNIACFVDRGMVFLSFRTYQFARFLLDNAPYIVCKDLLFQNHVYIVPDEPYFSSIPKSKALQDGESIELDGHIFSVSYTPLDMNINLISKESNGNSKKIKVVAPTDRAHVNDVKIKATDMEGSDILSSTKKSVYATKGKWVLLYFWSDSCGPCIQSLPTLNNLHATYDNSVFEIFGIMDVRSRTATENILKNNNVSWSNIRLSEQDMENSSYLVHGYPTTYLINPEGYIEKRFFNVADLKNILPSTLNHL